MKEAIEVSVRRDLVVAWRSENVGVEMWGETR